VKYSRWENWDWERANDLPKSQSLINKSWDREANPVFWSQPRDPLFWTPHSSQRGAQLQKNHPHPATSYSKVLQLSPQWWSTSPIHASFNTPPSKTAQGCFCPIWHLRITSGKNIQHLSSLLLMLITASGHPQAKSIWLQKRAKDIFLLLKKQTNKTATWLNTQSISPATCRLLHIKITSNIIRVQKEGH
jgi:hypothetical protein